MYTVVKEKELATLIQRVNALMKEGWIPLGGIGVGEMYYYQSMTR